MGAAADTLARSAADERADPRLTGIADADTSARRWRRMLTVRRFEEMVLALFEEGVLTGTTHACIGQEADAVGVCDALAPDDHVFSNHRCHGHYLARTGDARGLLAELMGKRSGVTGGIGGSQHLSAPQFKSNGVQGGIVPAAAGIALAEQLRGEGRLSAVFVGDGTFGEGVVYETLNIAALWSLPLLLVVEDNAWAQSTPAQLNRAGDLPARIEAFGIAVDDVDSTDVEVIAAAAEAAVEACRASGPRALVLRTYRLCHHSKNDDARPLDEVAARWQLDPIAVHAPRVPEAERERIAAEVTAALDELLAHVRELP